MKLLKLKKVKITPDVVLMYPIVMNYDSLPLDRSNSVSCFDILYSVITAVLIETDVGRFGCTRG